MPTKNFDTAGQLRSFDAQQPRSRSPSVGATADRRVCDKFDAENFFQEKLFQRVSGRSINDLYMVEVFSGTAGLTAAMRQIGMHSSLGVDAHVTKQVKAPVLRLDLTTDHGVQLLWKILDHPRVVAVHLGPPCGTSSRARDIRRHSGPDPKPLRSRMHPDGLPSLTGTDLQWVLSANALYKLSAEIFQWCTLHGILCSLENPARSYMWDTSFLKALDGQTQLAMHAVYFHHCMYNAPRKKRTKLLCNHPTFTGLALDCTGDHELLPWGRQHNKWATSLEVEYPHALCVAMARLCKRLLLQNSVQDVPAQLLGDDSVSLVQSSRAALGKQPRGKRLRPLVREFAGILRIKGPQDAVCSLPTLVNTHLTIPSSCTSDPCVHSLPKYAKRIKPPMKMGVDAGPDAWEAEYGVAWTPQSFVEEAAGKSRPGHFMDGVHPVLKGLFHAGKSNPGSNNAKHRTEQMRKWILRAQERKCAGRDGKESSPPHM